MRLTIFTIIFSYISIFSIGQTTFGIKAGLNLSKAVYLEEDLDSIVKPYRILKPGIAAGLTLIHQLNPSITLEADLLYAQKGLKFKQISSQKIAISSMNYLELPVSCQIKIIGSKYKAIYTEVGGYTSFWIYGRYIEKDILTNTKTAVKVDFDNEFYQYSRIDAGIIAGLVFTFKKMDLFLRYTRSMTGSSELNADALSNRVLTPGFIIKL
jgi:hypothetical protein